MLTRMDSYEIAEWEAYERAFGPLGFQYRDDLLAAVHEQLQLLNHLTGAQFQDNPAPEPRRWPRPDEVFKSPPSDADDDLIDIMDASYFE